MYAKLYHDVRPVFFNLFIEMESFGTCRFLAEPHAVTGEFVLIQVDRHHFPIRCYVGKNTDRLQCIYKCRPVIVALNQKINLCGQNS